MKPLRLDPDRLFPADPRTRSVARTLYEAVKDLPIVIETDADPEPLRQRYAGDRCIGVIAAPANADELRLCLRDLRVRCELGD